MRKPFRVGCVQCGDMQTEQLNLQDPMDVDKLGGLVARLLQDGHAVLAVDGHTRIVSDDVSSMWDELN